MPPRKIKRTTRISQAPINLSTCPEEEETSMQQGNSLTKTRKKAQVKAEPVEANEVESPIDQLQRVLQLPKTNKTLIKKLYSQRMDLVRFADKNLMRRVFWEPIFLSEPEGAKLAGYFLCEIGCDKFVDLLAKIVMKQDVTKAQLRGIGEALIIAYKLAEKNEQALDLEGIEDIWRFIIQNSVIAESPLDQRFSEITKALDDADRVKFEMMLQKILNSVLTPYSRCIDSRARFETMNYVFRFYPLFPLLQEDREKLFVDYLKDECVEIRCQAAMKTMVLFETFFNIIPVDFIQHVMVEVIDSMAKDANPSARACVYKGLRSLSQCAGAVNILEHAMRCIIAEGVNDKHEKVRLACFQLLNAIKEHRFIRFWDVVEVKVLLARFEVETDEKVLEQVVRLLFRSFHPKDQTTAKVVSRLERLVKDGGRNAAVNFCRLIYRLGLVSIDETVQLITTIFAFNVYSRWKKNDLGVDLSKMSLDESIIDAAQNYATSENKENEGVVDEEKMVNDESVTPEFSRQLVLFECAVILWKSIQKDLEREGEMEKKLEKLVLHLFHTLHKHYSDTALIGASYVLGALVRTKEAAKEMNLFASREINNLRTGDYSPENLGFLIDFVWKWQPEELLNAVLDDLTMLSQLKTDLNSPQKKKKKQTTSSLLDCIQRVPLVMSHLTTSQKIATDITTNHGFFLERFYETLSPNLPMVLEMYLSAVGEARELINGHVMVELFKVHLVVFEQLVGTALNSSRGAPSISGILSRWKTFIDWMVGTLMPQVNQLLKEEDPRWLDVFKIIESVFEVQPLILGLIKSSNEWEEVRENDDSQQTPQEICEQLFTSFCELFQALLNEQSVLKQLLLVITGAKQLSTLNDVGPSYSAMISKLLAKLGLKLPEWTSVLGDEMNDDQLTRGVYGFYQLMFSKDLLDSQLCEKAIRALVKTLIKEGIATLNRMQSIEDPRMHDFEVSPMIRLFVQRTAFRIKPMMKVITASLANLLTANFLPQSVEDLDELIYRLGATAQIAYLTDCALIETGKKIPTTATNQQTETVRQLLSVLRVRLNEIIQRDGNTITFDDGTQIHPKIHDDGLLSQLKQLIEFEEPAAFDE